MQKKIISIPIDRGQYLQNRHAFSDLGGHSQEIELSFVTLMQNPQISAEITRLINFLEKNFLTIFAPTEHLLIPCDVTKDSQANFNPDKYFAPKLSRPESQIRAFKNTLVVLNYLLPSLLRLNLIPEEKGLQNLLTNPYLDFDWSQANIYFDKTGQLIKQSSFARNTYQDIIALFRFNELNRNRFVTSVPFPINFADRRTFARGSLALSLVSLNRNLINISSFIETYLNDLNLLEDFKAIQLSSKTTAWIKEFLLNSADYFAYHFKR